MSGNFQYLIDATARFIERSNGPYSLKLDDKEDFLRMLTKRLKCGRDKPWKKFMFDQLGYRAFNVVNYTFAEKFDLDGDFIKDLNKDVLDPKDIAYALKRGVTTHTLYGIRHKFDNLTLLRATQYMKEAYIWLHRTHTLFRSRDKFTLKGKDLRLLMKVIHDLAADYNLCTEQYRDVLKCFDIPVKERHLCECYIASVELWDKLSHDNSINGATDIIDWCTKCFTDEKSKHYIDVLGNPDKQREAFMAISMQMYKFNTNMSFKDFFNTIDRLVEITRRRRTKHE